LWQGINFIIAKTKPSNKRELIDQITRAWHYLVTTEELCNQVNSMPRSCKAVIKIKVSPQNINTRNALKMALVLFTTTNV